MPKKFNAFDPTVALAGTAKIACDPDGTIRMFNESNVTIEFETTFGDYFYLPAWREDIFKIGYRVSQLDWRQFHIIEGQTPLASAVYGLVYAKDEQIKGTFPQQIQRWLNVGNTVATTLQILNGTSFPSSPQDNDVFYRSDRNTLYFYKSSIAQWLSTDDVPVTWSRIDTAAGLQPYSLAGPTVILSGVMDLRQSQYFTSASWNITTGLTNTSGNYWQFILRALTNGVGTDILTFDTSLMAASANIYQQNSLDLVNVDKSLAILITKVGAPTAISFRVATNYRKIG